MTNSAATTRAYDIDITGGLRYRWARPASRTWPTAARSSTASCCRTAPSSFSAARRTPRRSPTPAPRGRGTWNPATGRFTAPGAGGRTADLPQRRRAAAGRPGVLGRRRPPAATARPTIWTARSSPPYLLNSDGSERSGRASRVRRRPQTRVDHHGQDQRLDAEVLARPHLRRHPFGQHRPAPHPAHRDYLRRGHLHDADPGRPRRRPPRLLPALRPDGRRHAQRREVHPHRMSTSTRAGFRHRGQRLVVTVCHRRSSLPRSSAPCAQGESSARAVAAGQVTSCVGARRRAPAGRQACHGQMSRTTLGPSRCCT